MASFLSKFFLAAAAMIVIDLVFVTFFGTSFGTSPDVWRGAITAFAVYAILDH